MGYIISITLLTIDQRNIYLQKKKLSDLGSQWSKDELERFYAAYRKYGKDWRKVWSLPSLLYSGITFMEELEICYLGNHMPSFRCTVLHQHDYLRNSLYLAAMWSCVPGSLLGLHVCYFSFLLRALLLNTLYMWFTNRQNNFGNPSGHAVISCTQYMRS